MSARLYLAVASAITVASVAATTEPVRNSLIEPLRDPVASASADIVIARPLHETYSNFADMVDAVQEPGRRIEWDFDRKVPPQDVSIRAERDKDHALSLAFLDRGRTAKELRWTFSPVAGGAQTKVVLTILSHRRWFAGNHLPKDADVRHELERSAKLVSAGVALSSKVPKPDFDAEATESEPAWNAADPAQVAAHEARTNGLK